MIPSDAIINSLEEAIILFDKALKILYLNKTAEELFGKSTKDVLGKKFPQLAGGEQSLTPLIGKTLAEGRSFRGKSVNLNIGRIVNVDFNLSPLFQSGRIEGAVLSISENIHLDQRDEFDSESIDYLIGSIAHEIKNPLGGIKGAAQLLDERNIGPEIREYVDLILRETDRLNEILNDYLIICRKPSFNPVNIHEVLEKTISVMNASIRKSGVILKRLYDPSLPQVKGDESKLLQVFMNIIKNALESIEKGGSIEISTYPSSESVRRLGRTKRWAVIAIRDSGKGIAEEDLKKIFVPFFTRKKQGTGIGLALSRKIVNDHGGLIKVKSQKGKGTSFFIYIPFEKHE